MTQTKRRTLTVLGCSVLLVALTFGVMVARPSTAQSALPLATQPPASQDATHTQDETLIYVTRSGDVVRYTLADQEATVLLAGAYHTGDGENPGYYRIAAPLRPSPDGQWLLIATAKLGTWLVAMDGSTQRKVSPGFLSATWSPDSERIAYVSGNVAARDLATTPTVFTDTLYIENIVAGESPRVLVQSTSWLGFATWSPGCDRTAAATPNPSTIPSCGQHIFVLNGDRGINPSRALLVEVETGAVKELGLHVGPARETSPGEYRWSPHGDEFWVPGAGFAGVSALAFQTDGSPPRPLVVSCEPNCPGRTHTRAWPTSGGWFVQLEGDGRYVDIVARTLNGEEIVVAEGVEYLAKLDELSSTEVGEATTLVPLDAASEPDLWNQRASTRSGLRLRLPLQWEESRDPWGINIGVQNYGFANQSGWVALGDNQVRIYIGGDQRYGEDDEGLWQWFEQFEDGEMIPKDVGVPQRIINDYQFERNLLSAQKITIGGRPALRLRSGAMPFAEQVVVPMKFYHLTISIWPRPSTQDAVVDEILDSIVLPSQSGEAAAHLPAGLYFGPGTEYNLFGSTSIGQVVDVVGRNEAGDWVQLAQGLWVGPHTLTGVPTSLPIMPPSDLSPAATPMPQSPSPLATPTR